MKIVKEILKYKCSSVKKQSTALKHLFILCTFLCLHFPKVSSCHAKCPSQNDAGLAVTVRMDCRELM